MAVGEKAPVASLKKLKNEIDDLKKKSMPIDAQVLLRLLDFVESREKLLKEYLIHMNAVENHIVRVTEVLQKLPQVNMGLLAESLQAMVPKMDEIAYNTRKMVDYLEMAAGEEGEDYEDESLEETVEKAVGKPEDPKVKNKLKNIEEKNKALIDSLSSLSSQLDNMAGKEKTEKTAEPKEEE